MKRGLFAAGAAILLTLLLTPAFGVDWVNVGGDLNPATNPQRVTPPAPVGDGRIDMIGREPGDDGGVQSWGSGMTYVTRLRGCSPNPFARGTSVSYELAQYGPVELSIHDVSGRLVKRLDHGPRQSGIHVTRWNGTDDRGRAVPAGVYFVRLSAGGNASTGRLTLLR